MVREAGANDPGHCRFGGLVDLGHQVDLAIVADLAHLAEVGAQNPAARERRLDRGFARARDALDHPIPFWLVDATDSGSGPRSILLRLATIRAGGRCQAFWKRLAAAGATSSGGWSTIAPLSHDASQR